MKKFISVIMSVAILASAVLPMAVSAATFTDDSHIKYNSLVDATSYNVSLYSENDFANFEFTGFDKETKTLTVDANETITFKINDGEKGYQPSYNTDVDGNKAGELLGWHYGDKANRTDRCISTDKTNGVSNTYIKNDDYAFVIDGFFSGNMENTITPSSNGNITSTCTLEGGLPEGTHTFNVQYKVQFKSFSGVGSFGKWSTSNEFVYTDTLTIVSVKPKTTAMGGSIKVGENAGLRFGFTTDQDADEIEEYGFLYAYGSTNTLDPDAANVRKVVAQNHITHEDGTTTFNLVFTKIPTTAFGISITSCSYVVIDGVTYYSAPVTRNFQGVAEAVLASDDIDDATKAAVQDMLNQ